MKFFLTILSILISQLSFSQMKVEDIKSEGDVVKFIKMNYNPASINEWRDVSYCSEMDTTFKYDAALKHFYDSVNTNPSWFTMDINRDGKLDLAVCGCFDDYTLALIILSDKEGYKTANLSKGDYMYSPQILKKYNDSIFLFESIRNADTYNDNGWFLIMTDTIQFSKNSLVEININKSYKKVDHIFMARTGFKTVSKSLTINKKGDIFITLNEMDRGEYAANKYTIQKSSLRGKLFFAIAEELPFYKYSNNYECNVYDGYTWYTEIYFTDGTNVKIHDHMGVGPFGLRSIYDYAVSVFHDENRKMISSKKISSLDDKQQ